MKTHVTFVLDSSGSMAAIEDDSRGGFNSFLSDQRDEAGTATVTLYEFDTTVELVYEGRPIEAAPQLTADNYNPGGRTALHDALVTAIAGTETLVDSMAPANTPETVIIVVLTDGKENSSETLQEYVRERVKEKRNSGWEFLFIGANQDAALTASKMGMDTDRSLDMAHSGDGAQAAYQSTSDRISQARNEGTTGGYNEEDRRRQDDADG
jgi:Mg-chelatase subunit ChlD